MLCDCAEKEKQNTLIINAKNGVVNLLMIRRLNKEIIGFTWIELWANSYM